MKKYLANILLIVCSIAAFFIIGEAAVRVLGIDFFVDKTHTFDPELGVRPLANVATTHLLLTGERRSWWTTNPQGFRDDPFEVTKKRPRIAIFGDSVAEGYGVNNDEMFAAILDEKLKGTEVHQFGVSSFGTAQEYLLMQKLIPLYRPDLVLLTVFPANDIMDNSMVLSNDARPYYVNGSMSYEKVKKIRETSLQQALFFTGKYSRFISMLSYYLKQNDLLKPFFCRLGMRTDCGSREIGAAYLVFNKTYDQNWDAALETTGQLLVMVRDYINRENIPFIVVLVPNKEAVSDSYRAHAESVFPALQNMQLVYNKPYDTLKEFLMQSSIRVIDLLEPFRASPENTSFYYTYDGHWTREGHQFAAEVIYGKLINETVLQQIPKR